MNVKAAFLTTFDRPALLRQSLPDILRQTFDCGLPLLIQDDGSTDKETLDLLLEAEAHAHVTLAGRTQHDGLHAHLSTGRNFLEGVTRLMNGFGVESAILKLDDDIALAPGAIHEMLRAWHQVRNMNPATLSGLAGPETVEIAEPFPGVALTATSCSPACIHRLDLWRDTIQALGVNQILHHGWDSVFFHAFLPTRKTLRCFTTKPSVVYHTGHTGVHLVARDVNHKPPSPWAFPGEWEGGEPVGVVTEAGDESAHRALYGQRQVVPQGIAG